MRTVSSPLRLADCANRQGYNLPLARLIVETGNMPLYFLDRPDTLCGSRCGGGDDSVTCLAGMPLGIPPGCKSKPPARHVCFLYLPPNTRHSGLLFLDAAKDGYPTSMALRSVQPKSIGLESSLTRPNARFRLRRIDTPIRVVADGPVSGSWSAARFWVLNIYSCMGRPDCAAQGRPAHGCGVDRAGSPLRQ